ncbi:MAG: DUF4062 domain-containing protein [Methyloprofundus sp.]|nr:DUF4062 domain-containing protein [Methyloprofundus sp.]
MGDRALTVMVSSTVYGVEELLDRVYTLLTSFGYEVWMSHKGTVPVSSTLTAFDACLNAVERCDLFLGIITTEYGSGVSAGNLSITHQEMKKAIELNKPRWFLAHDHVVFARRLLKDLGYPDAQARQRLALKKRAASVSDLRVIELYEDATLESLPLSDRAGNWVQKFDRDDDASLFVLSQFSRYQDVEQLLAQNLAEPLLLAERIGVQDE